MRNLMREIRHALRLHTKDFRYAAMVVLTLAVCIGANTAVFTVVNSVLLRPLPIPRADDLMLLSNRYPNSGAAEGNFSSAGDYYDRRQAVTALVAQAMFRLNSQTLDTGDTPEQLTTMSVTPSLFQTVAVAPLRGRTFSESEGEIGSEQKVILSYGLWQRLYSGDVKAIGRDLRLGGRPFTIVGIMPADFVFVDPEVRLWVPLAFTPEEKRSHHSNNWYHIGRLKTGATADLVQAQVNSLNAANLERFPQWREFVANSGFHTEIAPLKELLVKDVRGTLYFLWAGAGLVLLIGVVNIASLVLARSSSRIREIGTRMALGASFVQVGRQLLIENALLALAGAAAGLAAGGAVLRGLSALGLERFPRVEEVRIDGTVIAFAVSVSLLGGILFSLLHLAYISRLNLTSALREGGRTGSSGRRSRDLRQAVVMAQVAFAFILLMGAGLLLASFRQLLQVDPGFTVDGILTASATAPRPRYAGAPELRTLMDRSLAALRRIPGVISAGATTGIPFDGNHDEFVLVAEDYAMKPGESVVAPLAITVTPGYLEAIGVRLERGRYFSERDTASGPRVVIVDDRVARKFWPDQDPIGKRMYVPSGPDVTKRDERLWLTVAGVVRSARLQNLAGTGNSVGAFYLPYAQNPGRGYTLAIRARTDAAALAGAMRTALASVDPSLAMFDVKTMAERSELSLSSKRVAMSLALAFGVIALFLAALGIYSVLAYLLSRRRREIGIRIAVGSTQGGIFRMFLYEGLALVGGGLVLGLVGVIGLQKVMDNHIYGIRPLDPAVLAGVVSLLGAVALAACVWPAWQAMRVDPMIVLNDQ